MNDIKSLVIDKSSILKDALEKINKSGRGLCFVVDGSCLLGVITDGDIRRYLIGGGDIHSPAIESMNTDFVKCNVSATSKEIRDLFSNKIKIIPLINNEGLLVDFADANKTRRIPILEPQLSGNELLYVEDCINKNWISSQGEYVTRFEQKFEDLFVGMRALAVSNGTVALHLALLALGIGNGDEVIVPNLTFAATINTVLHCGATPVLCDVGEDDWCINLKLVEKLITERTKAIIPVHLYGQVAEILAIKSFCNKNGLFLIEDCAEAFGSIYHGALTGSFGDASTFSFFGNKTISTGEGGMVLFRDSNIASKARILRDHGMSKSKRYWHEVVGYNYRMTNIQAAIGCAQMERFDAIVSKKKEIMSWYNGILSGEKWIAQIPYEKEDCSNSSWLYTLLLCNPEYRDDLIQFLYDYGIESRPVFYPLNQMDIYKDFGDKDKLNNSQEISRRGISLPSSIGLTQKDINYICSICKSFFDGKI